MNLTHKPQAKGHLFEEFDSKVHGAVVVENFPDIRFTSGTGIVRPTRTSYSSTGIDVLLLDHVIVGDGYYSMADSGDIKMIMDRVNNLNL